MAQNNNNVNNIEVIREINDRYVVIKYFDAEVIYDKETKFINATKLCQYISKVTGKQKKFYHWMELKQTQKFMEDMINKKVAAEIPTAPLDDKKTVPGIPGTENNDKKADARIPATASKNDINKDKKAVPGIPGTENNNNVDSENQDIEYDENKLSYVVKLGSRYCTEIRGTYLHLDLIPQLCNWASKEYAFKISYIINYINGIKDYDSAYSKIKDEKLESKTKEIKKLEEEHQKQLKAKDEEIKRMKEEQKKQLKAKDEELKKTKRDLKESEKKNEKKTTIIKEKNEKVKELEETIKIKTKELEKLKETKSEDDIEIKKLKRDIKLLKSQLEEALKNNKSLTERMDDFIKTIEKEREENRKREEEHKKQEEEYKQEMNKMLTTHDILINQMSVIIKEKFKVETENKEIKSELKGIPEIILIFISEKNDKQLYISRIKKDTESRVIKRLKDLKYKVFNKYQTYNSVIKYNEAIKEYKEAGFISTKRNYITLINITLDEFIEKIKETI